MRWHGAHGVLTREQARELLPPAACKDCINWVRVFTDRSSWNHFLIALVSKCTRCGCLLDLKKISDEAEKLGLIKADA